MIYENNSWRPDRTGEFPRLYEKFLEQETAQAPKAANGEKNAPGDDSVLANAIAAAYYRYMIDGDARQAQAVLAALLPANRRPAASRTWSDIEKAARTFAPQTNAILKRPSVKGD